MSYEESRDNYVIKAIQELSRGKDISHLQFFGHSNGGAVATLAAYDLSQRTDLGLSEGFKVSLLTFGQPHVGNKAFVQDFKARLPENRIGKFVRFVSQFDPIPKLLEGLNLALPEKERYAHHCTELTLDGYWLVDKDYVDSFVKKVECNINSLSDLITSIPADLSEEAIKNKVSTAFDPKKCYHGSWHHIYHLELILQGKRITVDKAGNVFIKNDIDIAVNKGGRLVMDWATPSAGSNPVISCVLSVVDVTAKLVYNVFELRKQNGQILGGMRRLEKNIADGVEKVYSRLDTMEQTMAAGVVAINELTKIDDAVTSLQGFVNGTNFQSKLNAWTALSDVNSILPDPSSYREMLVLAKEILLHSDNLTDQAKLWAMHIYVQTVDDLATNCAQKLTDTARGKICDDILPRIGNLIIENIETHCIARKSLMDLSSMANQIYRKLYDTPVQFIERDTTKETICWNAALHLSRNGGVDLLFDLFQLLCRNTSSTTSSEGVKLLQSNIKLFGNFLGGRKEPFQIAPPQQMGRGR